MHALIAARPFSRRDCPVDGLTLRPTPYGMDHAELALEKAERSVRECEQNVAVQRLIVRRLAERRLSIAVAKQELRQMEEALRIRREHLERLQNSG